MEYDQTVRLLYITQINMNTIASNNILYGQFFDLIKLQNENSINVPIAENGKNLLNEAYSNRFFWRINLVGLHKRLLTLSKKGKEVREIIIKEYELH